LSGTHEKNTSAKTTAKVALGNGCHDRRRFWVAAALRATPVAALARNVLRSLGQRQETTEGAGSSTWLLYAALLVCPKRRHEENPKKKGACDALAPQQGGENAISGSSEVAWRVV